MVHRRVDHHVRESPRERPQELPRPLQPRLGRGSGGPKPQGARRTGRRSRGSDHDQRLHRDHHVVHPALRLAAEYVKTLASVRVQFDHGSLLTMMSKMHPAQVRGRGTFFRCRPSRRRPRMMSPFASCCELLVSVPPSNTGSSAHATARSTASRAPRCLRSCPPRREYRPHRCGSNRPRVVTNRTIATPATRPRTPRPQRIGSLTSAHQHIDR